MIELILCAVILLCLVFIYTIANSAIYRLINTQQIRIKLDRDVYYLNSKLEKFNRPRNSKGQFTKGK